MSSRTRARAGGPDEAAGAGAGAHGVEEAHEDLRAQAVAGRQAHAHEYEPRDEHRRKAQAERVLG